MEVLDRETLLTLARHSGWPSVSIYLPTHRIPTQTEHDMIVLKNLIHRAEDILARGGMRQKDIDTLLQDAREFASDRSLWHEPRDGRAFFLTPEDSHTFKADIAFPQVAFAGERFLVRPLLPALDGHRRFYILALSKKRVRLFEGDEGGLREMDVPDMPEGMEEALLLDEQEREVQFHSGTPVRAGGSGRRAAIFHGHSAVSSETTEKLKQYFRVVDRVVHEVLRDKDAPLLLAAVEYLIPIYREANSYRHLLDDAILGNPDELTSAQLHERARDLLDRHFEQRLLEDKEELERLSGTASASHDIDKILPAAAEGRVRVLFIGDPESMLWGRFDPMTGEVETHAEFEVGDAELLDLAAAETLLRGGDVHVLPNGADTAAIFRY